MTQAARDALNAREHAYRRRLPGGCDASQRALNPINPRRWKGEQLSGLRHQQRRLLTVEVNERRERKEGVELGAGQRVEVAFRGFG